jgi:GGDEF domain-containing protein
MENVDVRATWTEWAILLEVADEHGASTIDPEELRRLVAAWSGPAPTSLYSPSRYALQVTVRATDPPAALAIAMSRWADARRRSCLPAWDLVRAEVLTSSELERELQSAERATGVTDVLPAPLSERAVADELLRRAFNDSVTGLPNREMFLDDVRRALAAPLSGTDVRVVVTVALQVDGRPQPPDDLLAEIGQRITAAVRRDDPVARVGMAEFAALVTLPFGDQSDRVAARLVHCVVAAGERHGRSLKPSVGVATASIGDDPDELITAAKAVLGGASAIDAGCHLASRPTAR